MALFSMSFVSYSPSSVAVTHQLTQGWFLPSSNSAVHCQNKFSFRALRPGIKAPSSYIRYPSRVSFARNSAPTPPDDDPEEEDSSQQQKERYKFDVENAQPLGWNLPSEARLDDTGDSVADVTTGSSPPSFLSSRVVDDAASSSASSDVDENQLQLRETLAALNQSLALLSATLNEVSSAVRILSAAISTQNQSPATTSSSPTPLPASSSFSSSSTYTDPDINGDRGSTQRNLVSSDPAEPWDNSYVTGTGEGDRQNIESTASGYESHVPPHLVEQNLRIHKLAYKLQQSFIQARIQGLGKPFQVAAEDFTDACIDAHALGIGLKELQLQLILQDGSLTGAFAIRNQRWTDDPILNEESRLRSLWVRLVYATLAQLDTAGTEEAELDPVDAFVKQVVQQALENGHELERVKLEQIFAGQTVNSGAVKAMRENQYLILLTLEKAKSQSK